MYKFYSILLCFVLLAGPSLAKQVRHWEFAGWYGGGCFPQVTFDPNVKNRVYLASDVTGIFRSDDLGENWRYITNGLEQLVTAQVAVAPSDSNVLYAATKTGVFVSQNAGDSWESAANPDGKLTFTRPENYRAIAVDAKDPAHVCAGTSKGLLFCSTNFGKSWKSAGVLEPQGKAVAALAFNAEGGLWAGTSEGFYTCAKSSCTRLENGPPRVTDFIISSKDSKIIYVAGNDTVWITADSGSTWTQTNAVGAGPSFRVDVDEQANPSILRVAWNKGWNGGIRISTDGGQTWQGQDSNLKADLTQDPTLQWAAKGSRPTSLARDPFNSKVLFRADWWSVWRSDDGGESWSTKIKGAPNTVVTQVIVAANGDIYVSTMDNGILRSKDGGKTYECLFPIKYDDNRAGHVWRMAVNGDRILGGSSPWNRKLNQIIVSSDGGNAFDLNRAGLPEGRPKTNTMWGQGYPRALTFDPSDPQKVYLGIDGDDGGGLFISSDGGQTWQRSAGQPGSRRVYNALVVDPTNPKRIVWGASAKDGGIYVSDDAGASFTLREWRMQWVFGAAIASDGTMYAAGDASGAKLFMSRDHGKTWAPSGTFDKGRALVSVAVDPGNPNRLAVGAVSWGSAAPNKVYLSEDGAKTWQDVTGDLPPGAGISTIAFAPDSSYLLIGRTAGSVYKMALPN